MKTISPRHTTALLSTVALAWAILLPGARPARAQVAGRDQVDPLLVGDLLVWSEDGGAGHQLRFKRLFDNLLPRGGAEEGGSALVRSADPAYQPGDQRGPTIADQLLVWSERRPGAPDHDLYAVRLSQAGFSRSGPVPLIERPGDQLNPSLVASDSGEYLLVWSENGTDSQDILGQRVSVALKTRGAVINIATGPSNAREPLVMRDPAVERQDLLVLWTDDRKGDTDIYGTRVSRAGLPRLSPTGTAADFPVIEGPGNQSQAAAVIIAAREDPRDPAAVEARSLLLWTDETGADGLDVRARRLHANGYAFGATMTVAGGPGDQTQATVAETEEGWSVAWSAPGPAKAPDQPATLDLFGVRVRANGRVETQVRRLLAD